MTMTAEWMIALASGLAIGAAATWLIVRRMRHSRELAASATEESTVLQAGRADAVILGSVDDPLLEITPVSVPATSRTVAASPAISSALQPLLRMVPDALHVGGELASKTYRVAFSPQVTRALRDGTLELLPSSGELIPVARKVTKGKAFVEQARVVKNGFKLANAAAMTWQIAAMVTAQHFLNEINAKLAGIERGIDDIRTWLEEEKKGQLSTDVRYLRECSAAISRGQLHPNEIAAIYSELERIERNCGSIGDLAREMSRRRLEELNGLDIREWSDRKGSADRAIKWIRHNQQALDLIFLAQSVRVVACRVKAMLPGDRLRLKERIEHAKQEIAEAQRLFESTREAFLAKVQDLRKRGDKVLALGGIFDSDHRRELENEFSIAREQVAQSVARIAAESGSARDLSTRLDQLADAGMQLDVRFNEQGEMEILTPESTPA